MAHRMTALFFACVLASAGLVMYLMDSFFVMKSSAVNYLSILSSQMNALREREQRIASLSGTLEQYSASLSSEKNAFDEMAAEYESLRSKKVLASPSFDELSAFVFQDKTNEKEYIEGEFDCTNFASEFVNNFAEKGFFSCMTYILLDNGAHALVAANTSDFGVVYVEAQDDKIIHELSERQDYCKKMGWDCNFTIQRIVGCFS